MEKFPFSWVMVPKTWPRSPLSPGKIYKVLSVVGYSPITGHLFYISDDSGHHTFCVEKASSLSRREDWIVVDYQENLEKILE